MQTNSSVHGIGNGHWEHIEAPSLTARLLSAAQERLNKLVAEIRSRGAHSPSELNPTVH